MSAGPVVSRLVLVLLLCLTAATVVSADSDGGRLWHGDDSTAESRPLRQRQQQQPQRQTGKRLRGVRGAEPTAIRRTGGTRGAGGEADALLETTLRVVAASRDVAAVARIGDEGGRRGGGGGDAGDPWGGGGNSSNSSTSSRSSSGVVDGVVGRRSLPEILIRSREPSGSLDGGHDDAEGAAWRGGRCWTDPSGQGRCQANVFLFGVSKCGTTSLATWMTHHPALRWVSNLAKIGEIGEEAHVLDEMGDEGFRAMLAEGPGGKYGQTAPAAAEEDKVIDYTPHCSITAEVPYRILDIYGDAARNGSNKYLVQLRDPVTRAISSWQRKFDLEALDGNSGERDTVGDTRSLADAIRQGQDGVKALLACQEAERRAATAPWDHEKQKVMDLEKCRLRDFLGETHGLYWAHVAKGMYAMQLERWFSLFGRENVKVTFLEETAADPVSALESVFDFIGLDLVDERGEKGLPSRQDWERVVNTIHNETEEERKKKLGRQVTQGLVLSMREFFAPHNARLEHLLGRPLPYNWST
ncbi:unnamed protein product [Scytosiphon promiscuus]